MQSKIGNRKSTILLFLLFTVHCSLSTSFAQQPQAQGGQPIWPANVKYVQGVGPGYWPTAGTALTLNLAPGTAVCSNNVEIYAGGTLALAASATNYVYLDTTNNCAPAANTTGFTSTTIPIATVVTSSSAITSILDVRTAFTYGMSGGSSSGSVTSVGLTMPGQFAVGNSPITGSGAISVSWSPVTGPVWFGQPTSTSAAPGFQTTTLPLSLIPLIPYTQITNTPTTLVGYGITSPLPVTQGGTGSTAGVVISVTGDGALFVNAASNGSVTLSPSSSVPAASVYCNPNPAAGAASWGHLPLDFSVFRLVEDFPNGQESDSVWTIVNVAGSTQFNAPTGSNSYPGYVGVGILHPQSGTSGYGGWYILAPTTAGNTYGLLPFSSTSLSFDSSFVFAPDVLTGQRLRVGIVPAGTNAIVPAAGLYLRYDTGLSTPDSYYMFCSNSGTETCASSGVAPSAATFVRLRIRSVSTGVIGMSLYQGGVLQGVEQTICPSGCTITATLTTSNYLEPAFEDVEGTTSADNLYIDLFAIQITGISR